MQVQQKGTRRNLTLSTHILPEIKGYVCVLVTQSCPTLCDLHGLQPPRLLWPMEFSRQEYQSGLPFPSPGDLPDPGIEPRSPALQADSLSSKPPESEVKVKVNVSQLCLTFCNPVDYAVHGILQARILEWVAFPFSRGSSQPEDQTQVFRIAGRFFTN